VSPDCRVTITATSADNFTAIGAIVDSGNSLDLIPTMPGVVVEVVVGKKL
jgi:hypothetical protein